MAASQDGYLRFATEQLTPTSPTSVLAHLTRADRDHRFRFDASAIGPDDFAAVFAKIDSFQDTSDFDMMQLVAIWYGHRRDITPELGGHRAALLGFRYWFTDPLPEGVIDQKWFWSENHRIIFHTLEYLAGLRGPDLRHHRHDRAGRGRRRPGPGRGVAGREGHLGLLGVAQRRLLPGGHPGPHAADRARRAGPGPAGGGHARPVPLRPRDPPGERQQRGHPRPYMKDKSRATDQDVFGTAKLLFGTSDVPIRPGPTRVRCSWPPPRATGCRS